LGPNEKVIVYYRGVFPNGAYEPPIHGGQIIYACVNGKFVKKFVI